jgi:hypothetical protein
MRKPKPGPPRVSALDAVRYGLARGWNASEICADLIPHADPDLVDRLIAQETVPPALTPQAQRGRRIIELEAIRRGAPDTKTLLASLRMLIRLDGSARPDVDTAYDEVWRLLARLEGEALPSEVQPASVHPSDGERRMWRVKLQRLRTLLLRSADDVAEFRALGIAPVGALTPSGRKPDRVGRMTEINLYAQQHAAVALHQIATNPALSPGQRAEAIGKAVATIAMNHPAAEVSEWAKGLQDMMKEVEHAAE